MGSGGLCFGGVKWSKVQGSKGQVVHGLAGSGGPSSRGQDQVVHGLGISWSLVWR